MVIILAEDLQEMMILLLNRQIGSGFFIAEKGPGHAQEGVKILEGGDGCRLGSQGHGIQIFDADIAPANLIPYFLAEAAPQAGGFQFGVQEQQTFFPEVGKILQQRGFRANHRLNGTQQGRAAVIGGVGDGIGRGLGKADGFAIGFGDHLLCPAPEQAFGQQGAQVSKALGKQGKKGDPAAEVAGGNLVSFGVYGAAGKFGIIAQQLLTDCLQNGIAGLGGEEIHPQVKCRALFAVRQHVLQNPHQSGHFPMVIHRAETPGKEGGQVCGAGINRQLRIRDFIFGCGAVADRLVQGSPDSGGQAPVLSEGQGGAFQNGHPFFTFEQTGHHGIGKG